MTKIEHLLQEIENYTVLENDYNKFISLLMFLDSREDVKIIDLYNSNCNICHIYIKFKNDFFGIGITNGTVSIELDLDLKDIETLTELSGLIK